MTLPERACVSTHYVFGKCFSVISRVSRCPNVSTRKPAEITDSTPAGPVSFPEPPFPRKNPESRGNVCVHMLNLLNFAQSSRDLSDLSPGACQTLLPVHIGSRVN